MKLGDVCVKGKMWQIIIKGVYEAYRSSILLLLRCSARL